MNQFRGMHLVVVVMVCGLGGTMLSGCAELVAQGQISDRETGGVVSNVEVRAIQPERAAKLLDTTDGRGNYWILKSKIPADAKIRLAKTGYYTIDMRQDEFLDSRSHLMTPTGLVSDPFDPEFDGTAREGRD